MAKQRRQQRPAQQDSQAKPSDSCAYSTAEIYRAVGKAAQEIERFTVEVTFPANASEVDCRDFGYHGELGAAIVRAIDPHRTRPIAVEKATTYRAREHSHLVLATRVLAPKGTLRDLALRLGKLDLGLDLGTFNPLPGSNLAPARARARVVGADKYVASQYMVSGVPTDIQSSVAWLVLERAYGLEAGAIQRAVPWNHTTELMVTTRPGAPRLPEEHTYSYRDGQQRTAMATLRATPVRPTTLEPTVSCAPPPRAHAQAARRTARQHCAGEERALVHHSALWEAHRRAEEEHRTEAAEAAHQLPKDPAAAADPEAEDPAKAFDSP